jgi:cytochrome c oxidase subunit 2
MREKWNKLIQEERSPISSGIYDLHEILMYYLIIILIFVIIMMIYIIYNNNNIISFKYIRHNIILEIVWTFIPAIILIIIAIPSFKLLYSLDEIINPILTVKAIGNQWFWSYEINDIEGINLQFDSYAKSIDDLLDGELRLLDVDNILYLPINLPIRLLTSSVDVIHSFTIPSLGLKIDAIPGRINHALIYLFNQGLSYGQCSELCGSSHYNMPISIKGVSPSVFFNWLLDK